MNKKGLFLHRFYITVLRVCKLLGGVDGTVLRASLSVMSSISFLAASSLHQFSSLTFHYIRLGVVLHFPLFLPTSQILKLFSAQMYHNFAQLFCPK